MLRVTVNFAIAFCVVTCLAAAVLGVRSRTIADQIVWRGEESTLIITSTGGRLDVGWWQTSIRPLPPMQSPVLSHIVSPAYPLYEPDPGWLGFVVRTGEQSLWWNLRAGHAGPRVAFLARHSAGDRSRHRHDRPHPAPAWPHQGEPLPDLRLRPARLGSGVPGVRGGFQGARMMV